MIAKKDRLKLNQLPDFFATSQKFFTPQLTFFYQKLDGGGDQAPEPQSAQIAIIIPKKAYRLATRRNYLKRLIAAQIQPLLPDFASYQVAIVAKASPQPLDKNSISLLLHKFLQRLTH